MVKKRTQKREVIFNLTLLEKGSAMREGGTMSRQKQLNRTM